MLERQLDYSVSPPVAAEPKLPTATKEQLFAPPNEIIIPKLESGEIIVFNHEFADSSVIPTGPHSLVAFGTMYPHGNLHIQKTVTHDMGNTWGASEEALAYTPHSYTWAPEPFYYDDIYWLLYAEHDGENNVSFVRAAHAKDPHGQYETIPGSLAAGPGLSDLDPGKPFVDPKTGETVAVRGSGWVAGSGIVMQRFDPTMMSYVGEAKMIAHRNRRFSNETLIEGAFLDYVPDSEFPYQLHYCGDNYIWRYANMLRVSKKLWGPYIPIAKIYPQRKNNIILSGDHAFAQPGQISKFGSDYIAFHAIDPAQPQNEDGSCRRVMLLKKMLRDQYGLPIPMTPTGYALR